MATKGSILVLCAHSDDQVLGAGGTLAKYADEGKKVHVVIFSYGEKSHPWLKKHIIAGTRVQEAHDAENVLGIAKTEFIGLTDQKVKEEIGGVEIEKRITGLVKKLKPGIIFTHTPDDPHPDHRAISAFVQDLAEKKIYRGPVYCFDVWTPVNISSRHLPRVVIDISGTFSKKIKALRCFKSQWMTMISLMWSVYWKAIKNGRQNKMKYAEVFYKLR